GSPVSAVLLAVELLLFELRPRSLIPVALAAAAATAVRIAFVGIPPAFAMPNIAQPGEAALTVYVVLGAAVGVAAVAVTKIVYAVEDAFDHLPIHWMWWPAIGAVAVGVCGYFAPHTLGVGYDNIDRILSGDIAGEALLFLGGLKFISWSISLGGCTASFLLSCLMMRNTIMTEKIARRGVRVPGEYAADFLDQVTVGLCASKPVVTLNADDLLEAVRGWIAGHGQGSSHQGFPV